MKLQIFIGERIKRKKRSQNSSVVVYLDNFALAQLELERLAGETGVKLLVVGLQPPHVVHADAGARLALGTCPLLNICIESITIGQAKSFCSSRK